MRIWLVAVLLAGCAAPPELPSPEPSWHGRDTSEEGWLSVTLKPCQFLEIDYEPRSDELPVTWDWFVEDRTSIQWDLHTHGPDGRPMTLDSLVAPQGKGDGRATPDDPRSMTWTNPHDDAVTLWHQNSSWTWATLSVSPSCLDSSPEAMLS